MGKFLVLAALLVVALLAVLNWRSLDVPAAPTSIADAPPAEDEDVLDAPRVPTRAPAEGLRSDPRVGIDRPQRTSLGDRGCTATISIRSSTGDTIPAGSTVAFTDDRGGNLREHQLDAATYRIQRLDVGRYRGVVWVPDHELGSTTFEVLDGEREKHVEVVVRPRTPTPTAERRTVLVRWQDEGGQPFLPAFSAAKARDSNRVGLAVRTSVGISKVVALAPSSRSSAALYDWIAGQRPGAPVDSVALLDLPVDAARNGGVVRFEACLDELVLDAVEVAEHADEVVFRTSVLELMGSLVRVRACVVSAAGRVPIQDYQANLEVVGPPRRKRSATRVGACFTFEEVVPVSTELRITASGAVLAIALDLVAGRDVDLGEITIPDGCAYSVRFTDVDGQLVTFAYYFSCARTDFGSEWPRADRRQVAPRGTGQVVNAPVEGALLIASARGYALTAIELPPCGSRGAVEVRLVPGTEVVLDAGLGETAAGIQLATGDGLPLGLHPASSTGLLAVRLAPGAYSARVRGREEITQFRVAQLRVASEPLFVLLE